MDEKTLTTCFRYLDKLRDSGRCNMWGAAEPMRLLHNMTERDARQALRLWMHTSRAGVSLGQRVHNAIVTL